MDKILYAGKVEDSRSLDPRQSRGAIVPNPCADINRGNFEFGGKLRFFSRNLGIGESHCRENVESCNDEECYRRMSGERGAGGEHNSLASAGTKLLLQEKSFQPGAAVNLPCPCQSALGEFFHRLAVEARGKPIIKNRKSFTGRSDLPPATCHLSWHAPS